MTVEEGLDLWQGCASGLAGGDGFQLRATTGSLHEPLGNFYAFGGYQFSIGSRARFDGLTPGQPYTFSIEAKAMNGTIDCRPASFPDEEHLTITVADAAFST